MAWAVIQLFKSVRALLVIAALRDFLCTFSSSGANRPKLMFIG